MYSNKENILFIFLSHLSESGDPLLWVGIHLCVSSVNIFFSRIIVLILTKFGM